MSKAAWTSKRCKYSPVKKHPLFKVWSAMKARCYTPSSQKYKDYGARGITVCDRWRYSFENFVDDMGNRPAGTSIDRINNNGNYEPSNCRWATPKQQRHNQRQRIGTAGYMGISSRMYKGKTYYHTSIWYENTQVYIGSRNNPIDAAEDYDYVARQLFGEEAILNFPDK